MTGRIAAGLSSIVLLVVLAACGSATTITVTATVPTRPSPATVHVYFLRDGKVQPVARQAVAPTRDELLKALAAGPSAQERQLGLTTAISGWTAYAPLPLPTTSPELAQVVYTLTQFAPTEPVTLYGKRYTRADFEDFTPLILVESPLPFETVRSPLRATGTANTFEATFQYELTDPDGKIVAQHFVTATSGNGMRGTFDFTVPFTVDRSGVGELIVYEISAATGKRTHIVEIPLRLER